MRSFDLPIDARDPSPGVLYPTLSLKRNISHLIGVTPEASGGDSKTVIGLLDPRQGWYREEAIAKAKTDVERERAEVFGVPKMNGFLTAIHGAYAQHFPLALSPDHIWTVIAQGFANHVNANAETLRSRFVAHEDKKELWVQRDLFVKGSPDNDWPGVFDEFGAKIAEHIGDGKRRLLTNDFSTTTPLSKAASDVVLMDAMQSYFSYGVRTMCGIPRITLLGETKDWENIVIRARNLAEYECQPWIAALVPCLEQFVRASKGDVDVAFWQQFYKENDGSGGPWVTGWVNVFFPYLMKAKENKYAVTWNTGSRFFGGGPTPDQFPYGLSRVPFVWKYYTQTFKMEFLGGFGGATQDPNTGEIQPVFAWGVADKVEQPNAEGDD